MVHPDFITGLPRAPTTPSSHYSGLISISATKHIHYYYIESFPADPLTSPLVFWTNGGPVSDFYRAAVKLVQQTDLLIRLFISRDVAECWRYLLNMDHGVLKQTEH